jgi:5-methylcytosine-specific restriction endonuclease McrA
VSDPIVTQPTKRCTHCKIEKPATSEYFYVQKWKDRAPTLRSMCRDCYWRRQEERIHNPDPIKYPSWKAINKDFPDICEQPTMTKRCVRCGDEHPHTTEYFQRNSQQPWGLQVYCKSCIKTYQRGYIKRDYVKKKASVTNNLRRTLAGTFTGDDIEAIRKAQGGRCYICHKKLGKKYHIDHFIPIKLGGTNDPGNLRLACPHCNLTKSGKHPHDMGILI